MYIGLRNNNVSGKKRKSKDNEDDKDDNDNDNDDNEEQEFEGELPSAINNETIYRIDNHIYFRARVTTITINKLCKLITEANNEVLHLQRNIKQGKLIAKPLYLHITSDGGTLIAGFMAYDAIENSQIPIYTVVEGYAFSAATVMSIAGRKIYDKKLIYVDTSIICRM